jgi:hypothetical protein
VFMELFYRQAGVDGHIVILGIFFSDSFFSLSFVV